MLENNFDKEIREKLESIQPTYNPEAWQKLKKSLPIPWYTSLLSTYGGWIFGGIASSLLLFNVLQNRDITTAINTLDLKNNSVDTKVDTVFVNKTSIDTVYLTKIERVFINNNFDNQGLIAQNSGIQNSNASNKASKNVVQNNNILDNYSKVDSKNSGILLSANKEIPKDDVAKENNYKKLYEELISKIKTDEEAYKKEELKQENKETQDKVLDEKPKVADLIIPEKNAEAAKSKSINIRNINARFGISSNYLGNNVYSFGPEVEFFLNNRISIGSGIQISSHKKINYSVTREFNKGTGKEFEERYSKFINEKPQKIENIKIVTSITRLPIFINYYFPINYKFNFVVKTGTKLNLSVNESVSFTGERLGNVFNRTFDSKYKPSVFNNLYYGMGVQYQYSRIYAQVIPYFDFSFNKNSFLVPPKNFGINASVKFSLKK